MLRIGLIGYGEVGSLFAAQLQHAGHDVVAADLRAPEAGWRDRAAAAGIELHDRASALPADRELLISAVTAAAAVDAARSAAASPRRDCWYLDLNSVAPATKAEVGAIIEAAGGRFIEAAVMSAVPPFGLAAPMLIGGPRAAAAAPLLTELGFRVSPVSDRIGVAAATKMCRSVVVKGLEAIVVDGFTAARHYGVEAEVITYLKQAFPGFDWDAQAAYFFERMTRHGRRRGEEMEQAAVTLRAAGIDPALPEATAARQHALSDPDAADANADWRVAADRLLDRRGPTGSD